MRRFEDACQAMPVDPAHSQHLNLHTAGMKVYLDEAAVHRVVAATGLFLKPNVDFTAFSSQLNDTVRMTMLRMLPLPISNKKLEELKLAFDKYEYLSKELRDSKYFPPLTPRKWHIEAVKWFSEMEELYKVMSKGGRKKNFIIRYFYPRAIALYHAGFGVTPVSTTSENVTLSDGPTARFLNAIFAEVENSIGKFGFDKIYTEDEVARLATFKTTAAALRKNIHKAMQLREPESDELRRQLVGISSEEAKNWPRRRIWEIYSDYYEKFILSS